MKILIVEDEPVQRTILAEACRTRGHEVRAYASHSDILEMLRAWRPELVICTLETLALSAEEVARAAAALPSRPWVMLTAAHATHVANGRDIADAVLIKPFHLAEMMNLVELMGAGQPSHRYALAN
jgi:DNA-binding response OmpR family regulator